MGALADSRLALKEALTDRVLSAGGSVLTIHDVPPAAMYPPAVFLEPADPWWSLNDRLPADMAEVRWEVLAVAARGTQEAMTPTVEALAEQVIDAVLAADGWTVTSVTAPLLLTLAQDTYPAIRITVAIPAVLTTEA